MHVSKVLDKPVHSTYIFESIVEILGYFSLKADFKTEILQKITSDKTDPEKLKKLSLLDSIKYLILLSVQTSTSSKLHLLSSVIFMILNLVRSDSYDLQIPSLTLKIHDQLKDKDISYYELK